MNESLFVKMVLDAWHTQLKRTGDLFGSLSNEDLQKEIAPGKNRGLYLLGHLTAIHDRMLPLLGLGDVLYPQLYGPFVESPDKAVNDLPSVEDLRRYWKEINAKLTASFTTLSAGDWFQRHNAVSEEDFKKEPHRNRLNLVMNRTGHLASHFGQLLYLKPTSEQEPA